MRKIKEIQSGNIVVRLAQTKEEIEEAQKLRYKNLVYEFNKSLPEDGIDVSPLDEYSDHLIAIDIEKNKVVGNYRLIMEDTSKGTDIEFYSKDEFDLSKLKSSGKILLETGRAVVDDQYRNGSVIRLLILGILEFATKYNVDYIFGTTSFHGTDVSKYNVAFKYLYEKYRVNPEIDCKAQKNSARLVDFDGDIADRALLKQQLPGLLNMYLLLGARVASELYIDYEFNSVDTFTIIAKEDINFKFIKAIMR